MTLTTIRMGKHCGAQVNACANERNASKLAISLREQPSVYDEVINVNVIVIVIVIVIVEKVQVCNFRLDL